MLPIILLVVVIIVVGVGVLAYRNRAEKGIESGITSFRRELSALAPREDERRPGAGRAEPPNRGVTVVGSDDHAEDHGDDERGDDEASDLDTVDDSSRTHAEAGPDDDTTPDDAEERTATDESRDT